MPAGGRPVPPPFSSPTPTASRTPTGRASSPARWTQRIRSPAEATASRIRSPRWPARSTPRSYGDTRDFPDLVEFAGSYNLGALRSALESVGGFDESYRAPSGEDNDLSYRWRDRGVRIRFARGALVDHHHPTSLGQYLREQVRHGRWRVVLYAAHPGRMRGDGYAGVGDLAAPPLAILTLIAAVVSPLFPVVAIAAASGFVFIAAFHLALALRVYAHTKEPAAFLLGPVGSLRAFARGRGLVRGTLDVLFRRTRVKVLAIVPAFNEERSVGAVVREILATGRADVLVVDDGSSDGTAAAARATGARVLVLPFNLGIGGRRSIRIPLRRPARLRRRHSGRRRRAARCRRDRTAPGTSRGGGGRPRVGLALCRGFDVSCAGGSPHRDAYFLGDGLCDRRTAAARHHVGVSRGGTCGDRVSRRALPARLSGGGVARAFEARRISHRRSGVSFSRARSGPLVDHRRTLRLLPRESAARDFRGPVPRRAPADGFRPHRDAHSLDPAHRGGARASSGVAAHRSARAAHLVGRGDHRSPRNRARRAQRGSLRFLDPRRQQGSRLLPDAQRDHLGRVFRIRRDPHRHPSALRALRNGGGRIPRLGDRARSRRCAPPSPPRASAPSRSGS